MKIAVVTPWYTENISGGAERFAGGIAKSLQDAGCNVEILTTCGKDSFWDWGNNFYKEEVIMINSLKVRRFFLRKRNVELYDDCMGSLINNKSLSYVQEMQLLHETVNSDSLYSFIAENSEEYIFLFIPYLFGTTFWGSKINPEHTFIIPCVHDEDMAYFKSMGHMFQRVKGLLFNAIEEQKFASDLHGIPLMDSIVSGGGVEVNITPDPEAFRLKYNIEEEYFIYVGRQVSGKNVPQLIELFNRYTQEHSQKTKLLFLGKGEDQIIEMMKTSPNIIHIGEVSDQDKYDGIAGAIALIQPSLMESFSIVIMESWLCDVPVIVHELCAVTKGHCDRSEGGLYYKDYESFEQVINKYITSLDDVKLMGKKGHEYVNEYYTWENTAERMLTFFEEKGFKRENFIG
jgi:glycosyltransferase involved in cell wall biosynthesis